MPTSDDAVSTTVPGDKSIAIRALLLALIARHPSRITGVPPSRITVATLGALRALGASVDVAVDRDATAVAGRGDAWTVSVTPPTAISDNVTIDCGGSATLARLLLGLLAGRGVAATITGSAMLRRRPMTRVAEPLGQLWGREVIVTTDGRLPARVQPGGPPRPNQRLEPGNSAQVRASLMLAAVAAGVPITLWSPWPGRRHTEQLLRRCGTDVVEDDAGDVAANDIDDGAAWRNRAHRWRRTTITPRPIDDVTLTIPADPSAAAFLFAAAAVATRPLRIQHLVVDEERDGFVRALGHVGLRVERSEVVSEMGLTTATVTVHPGPMHGLSLAARNVADLIDEVPILAAVCTQASSPSTLHGLAELRVKESDRLARIMELLGAFGATTRLVDGDTLHIEPATLAMPHEAITTDHDHRVAMTAAVLAGFATGRADAVAALDDVSCADDSWPGFVEQLVAVRRALA